jgi:hypothetical protein
MNSDGCSIARWQHPLDAAPSPVSFRRHHHNSPCSPVQVYGRYSRMKKYAKMLIRKAIKEKLGRAATGLAMWLKAIWDFVKEYSVRPTHSAMHAPDAYAAGAPPAAYAGGPWHSLPARRADDRVPAALH